MHDNGTSRSSTRSTSTCSASSPIASALLFVTRKSPVAAALWLVNTMFCLAALYVMLDAQFIGAIQVLVYAGAIMVVFLFVIMLLNLGHRARSTDMRGRRLEDRRGRSSALAMLAEIFALTRARDAARLDAAAGVAAPQVERDGAIAPIAGPLFHEYLLAFEVDERAAPRGDRRRGGARQAARSEPHAR